MKTKRPYEPSQQDIRRECERIRRGWTKVKRRSMRVLKPTRWELPVISYRVVTDAVAEQEREEQT